MAMLASVLVKGLNPVSGIAEHAKVFLILV